MVPSFLTRALRPVVFLAAFACLQLAWQACRGSAVERVIVHDCTVEPAALLVNLLTPAVRARAAGSTLQAAGGGLNILNGCEGLEALFLLYAAFLAAPLPWRARLRGALLGTLLVFAINQARIVALFYAARTDADLFGFLHAQAAPIAVIVLVGGYFYAWLEYARAPAGKAV
jgi:exosortase/archaeosortase family protein